jgi:hypothetical protein
MVVLPINTYPTIDENSSKLNFPSLSISASYWLPLIILQVFYSLPQIKRLLFFHSQQVGGISKHICLPNF